MTVKAATSLNPLNKCFVKILPTKIKSKPQRVHDTREYWKLGHREDPKLQIM